MSGKNSHQENRLLVTLHLGLCWCFVDCCGPCVVCFTDFPVYYCEHFCRTFTDIEGYWYWYCRQLYLDDI